MDGLKASVGQAADEPVQLSATSQISAAGRHTVVVGRNVSVGHDVVDPVQFSAVSQIPAEARHV